jgi:hypothetical protein
LIPISGIRSAEVLEKDCKDLRGPLKRDYRLVATVRGISPAWQ